MREEVLKPKIPLSVVLLFGVVLLLNACAEFLWDKKMEFDFRQPRQNLCSSYEAEIASDVYRQKYGSFVLARVNEGQEEDRRVKLQLGTLELAPQLGEIYQVHGSSKRRNFDQYDKWLFKKGIIFETRVKVLEAKGFKSGVQGSILKFRSKLLAEFRGLKIDERAHELLEAILLGEGSGNEENERVFRVSGLSHLIAVSGSHLSILAAFVFFVLSPSLGRKKSLLLVLPVVFAFHVISGAQDSSNRATIMLLIVSLSQLGRRRADPLHALGVGGLLLVVYNPLLALSLGFQLSASAIFGIFIFLPLISVWIERIFPYLPRAVNSALSMTLIGQVSTLPLTLPAFGELSLIAPLANLVSMPLMAFSLNLAIAGSLALFIFRPLGLVVLKLSELGLNTLIWVADTCANIPWASLSLKGFELYLEAALLFFFLLLYLWWPSPRLESKFSSKASLLFFRVVSLALFLTTLVLALLPQSLDPLINLSVKVKPAERGIYCLDVGQGDATLVLADSHTALIDAGPDKDKLKQELRKLKVKKIDTLYLTHLHSDHYEGAFALKSFDVKEVVVAKGAAENPIASRISRYLKAGLREIADDDIESIGQFEMEVFGPNSTVNNAKENETSLIMLIDEKADAEQDFRSLLITGDAESWQILSAFSDEKRIPQIDVLSVGHHGSRGSLSPSLLMRLKPKAAVISLAADNEYGHPSKQTINYLKDYKIPVTRTDISGTIYLGMN